MVPRLYRAACYLVAVFCFSVSSCRRNEARGAAADAGQGARVVVIAQAYNEIFWALGANRDIVGVDYSSTYPPEIAAVTKVGYHRALSAEGILSLRPTLVIHDGNVGPDAVLKQLDDLKIPVKQFAAKNDSLDGTKALVREIGAYAHAEARAEEICTALDHDLAEALHHAQAFSDRPSVAVIHFGRAMN